MNRTAWAAALIIATAVLAYAPTVDNYFVQDDFGVVWLLSQKPPGYFPTWFVTSWMDTIWGSTPDEVRPFVAVTYQAAAALGPATPWPNHVINIGFHAATAILVAGLARHGASVSLVGATFAGVIFVLLPNQAETVAWITGRVDSMPAFFYIAACLAWIRWRHTGRRSAYAWSVLWCLVALFSKQNTITLVPALFLYDAVVVRALPRWRAYVPHATLTAGYLALRYALFGEVAREGQLTSARLGYFTQDAVDHVVRVVAGDASPSKLAAWALGAVAVVTVLAIWIARGRGEHPSAAIPPARSAVYFGPIWIAIGLLPTLMSTYSSTRHAYLASAGWALLTGMAFETAWRSGHRRAREMAGAAGVVLLVLYAVQLRELILEWEARARVAARAVDDIEREALAAPPGTLIMAGVPPASFGFALPFAAQRPFSTTDVTNRARLIFHSSLYCCPANLWEPYTRDQLRAWLNDPRSPPAVALHWEPGTGRLSRVTTIGDPTLPILLKLISETENRAALDSAILRVLDESVALRYAEVTR